MQTLNYRLDDETKAFKDIAFVDLVDVYRNLPDKLLLYFQKLVSFFIFLLIISF